jgi:AraC-like DNA-binding protein
MAAPPPQLLKLCDAPTVLVVVLPVDRDSRGIIQPEQGLARFRLERVAPSPVVGRFVDRYWIVSWDLRGQPPHTQQVLAHPVVNVVLAPEGATVNGVTTRVGAQVLSGAGRVLGIMFRPGGFRPFLDRPASEIVDRVLAATLVFGPDVEDLARTVEAAASAADMAALADRFLAARVPARPHPCEETVAIAERIATDPTVVRVEHLARDVGLSTRQLQRRFRDHVGMGPKAVIRRYRLFEVAERARVEARIDWAALAAELGYSDQAHLTRDFTAAIGIPPARYARLARKQATGPVE